MKWQVAAKAKGTKSEFIVENGMGQGYILAYQIDAWAEAGKPNVKRAWIGRPGEEPQEIEVMEWKESKGGYTPEFNGDVTLQLTGCSFDEKIGAWLKWEADEK